MADYAPKLRKLLRKQVAGWGGRGDHEIWHSPLTDRPFPVDHKIKSRHTANGILKQAGLPKAF